MGIGSWFGKLVGGAAVETATGVADIVDRFVTTPDEKAAAKTLLAEMAREPDRLQAAINKVEAGHRTMFVAGWRPFIGWICGVCLGMYFIPQYALGAYLWVKMCLAQGKLLPYPVSDEALMELVFALLGMGTLRMVDKLTGKSK